MSLPTQELIRQKLSEVLDPETHLNIVDMGFIRQIKILKPEESRDNRAKIYIVYTLTTPGCPLAGTIQNSIKQKLGDFPDFDPENDIYTELTFDPPWSLEDMSEEARAELDF